MEPQINADERRLEEISGRIIDCAYSVSNALGCGFLEKVYENALAHEMRKAGLQVEQQKRINVSYDGVVVGDYVADLMVENEIIVEVKTVKTFDDVHLAQWMNHLKATGRKLFLLLNFGQPRVSIKRVVNKL